MEDARVDEDGAELATEEKLVRISEEDIVDIKHHDALVLDKSPCIQLVKAELESGIEVELILKWAPYVRHSDNPHTFA